MYLLMPEQQKYHGYTQKFIFIYIYQPINKKLDEYNK